MEIIHFSHYKNEYMLCGMIKPQTENGLFYVGESGTNEDFEREYDMKINDISDLTPVVEWTPTDYAEALDDYMINNESYSNDITAKKILQILPKSVDDAKRTKILKGLYKRIIRNC